MIIVFILILLAAAWFIFGLKSDRIASLGYSESTKRRDIKRRNPNITGDGFGRRSNKDEKHDLAKSKI